MSNQQYNSEAITRSPMWHDPDVRLYRDEVYALAGDTTVKLNMNCSVREPIAQVPDEVFRLAAELRDRFTSPTGGNRSWFWVGCDIERVRFSIPLMEAVVSEHQAEIRASHAHANSLAALGRDHSDTQSAAAVQRDVRLKMREAGWKRRDAANRFPHYLLPPHGVIGLCGGPPRTSVAGNAELIGKGG